VQHFVQPERGAMKKPVERPIERPCPACNGTGMALAKPPVRPGVRIFAQCKECGGKGRIIVD
jgi:DnaJ-class molecular chaperone